MSELSVTMLAYRSKASKPPPWHSSRPRQKKRSAESIARTAYKSIPTYPSTQPNLNNLHNQPTKKTHLPYHLLPPSLLLLPISHQATALKWWPSCQYQTSQGAYDDAATRAVCAIYDNQAIMGGNWCNSVFMEISTWYLGCPEHGGPGVRCLERT
ncbi:hypothetical protein EJ03DRAFT_99096 [Teratosphaeria nubilosa]|uniref:Uncharacterized protein n=1 Tax=Teratosphaeria nubilosa TaxID=161662 RepID=A0A6G1L9L8_9PEZI|nr:hypothetical protein EJ03DRAFT_99096 [Teratosphaeria nubilosa]